LVFCHSLTDEVDAFLTKRGAQTEHEATLQAKTEFMQLWDGMEGARASRVLVMGATNRPWMVDEAVLRWVGVMALLFFEFITTHDNS
jgi:SpoVK/Ycf46/Vps4 family AAA+-type ATPase